MDPNVLDSVEDVVRVPLDRDDVRLSPTLVDVENDADAIVDVSVEVDENSHNVVAVVVVDAEVVALADDAVDVADDEHLKMH